MPAASTEKDKKPGGKPEDLKVTVSFPLAGKGPYKDDVEPATPAESVRGAAMSHFGVVDDQTTSYYMTHKGDRVGPTPALGELADNARALKLTLVKELIQG